MVLHVLSDPGEVRHHRDAQRLKLGGRTDTRHHQELRRLESAGRDDDLFGGSEDCSRGSTLDEGSEVDADRRAVLNDDVFGQRAGKNGEIGALLSSSQVLEPA